jgi:hypothetical protein
MMVADGLEEVEKDKEPSIIRCKGKILLALGSYIPIRI